MLKMLYLKALILYLLRWLAAAFAYQIQLPELIDPPPADGSARSSVIFLVAGNVYPKGYYYATIYIGRPPKPYFLDIDTGSTLTWVQCNPCKSCKPGPHPLYTPDQNLIVRCNDPICASVNKAHQDCNNPNEQCGYKVEYADYASSSGVLVRDSFPLKLTNGTTIAPLLAFGCGQDQEFVNPDNVPYTDGVLGLGIGNSNILEQLRDHGVTSNIVGHCFSVLGGGFLFFGDVFNRAPTPGLVWTPIVSRSDHYFLGPADLQFGNEATNIKGIPVIFDSGTTYTYFSSQAYSSLVSLIKNSLNGKQLTEVEDGTLPICWKGENPFQSLRDGVGYFQPLLLSFGEARDSWFQIKPEGYLIVTEYGNVCLGILDGSEVGLGDLNMIGDISMQDKLVIYDNERQLIGWVPSNCY